MSRIVGAVLLGGVCHLAAATPQSLQLATSGPPTMGPQLRLPPAGRAKELTPGMLLVAARGLTDPNFVRTVVVLIDHNEDGTAGLVVNRQTDVPLSRVFEKLPAAKSQSAPVYVGGPVSMTAAQALVRSPAPVAQGRHVADDIYVLGTLKALEEKLASGIDPERVRVYLGYAGWSPGQLDQEVGVGAWHILAAQTEVVFDPDPDTLWHRTIKRTEVILARDSVRPRMFR